MIKQMTSSWLQKYANVNKAASYQDKLSNLYAEKNIYYLLEWLIFPITEEAADEIRFGRSPSMIKNSYLDFTEVFFNQICFDLVFKASDEIEDWSLITAIDDLQSYYGVVNWTKAVENWNASMEEMGSKYELFVIELQKERNKLKIKYKEQVKEIKETIDEGSEEQKMQLQNARDFFEQKDEEAPRKLISKKYQAWGLVAYIHFSQCLQPMERLKKIKRRLQQQRKPNLLENILKMNEHSFEAYRNIVNDINESEALEERFTTWVCAYASKTLMTIQHVDVEKRQFWWLGLLKYLSELNVENDKAYDKVTELKSRLWKLTFKLNGIDEAIMREAVIPSYFHNLVHSAILDIEQRRWLREVVILRYWEVFIQAFVSEEYDEQRLSWVLCLDPESLEKRLIRGLQQAREAKSIDLTFMVERMSQIFKDAVRGGLRSDLMTALFKYLTIHQIDFMYSYIQKIKSPDELFPFLQLDLPLLQRLFSGHGVRAGAARRVLIPLYIDWLSSMGHSEGELFLLKQWSYIFHSNKSEIIVKWLEHYDSRKGWNETQADHIEEFLEIKWLGRPEEADLDHEKVKKWLIHHSDWITFDEDIRSTDGVKYRIIRPGFKDVHTDKVLSRVIVRTEISDANEISSFLDDLKNI